MRMLRVVIIPPVFNRELCFGHRHKPMRVEALVAESAVEAFDERILRRLPRLNEGQDDPASS